MNVALKVFPPSSFGKHSRLFCVPICAALEHVILGSTITLAQVNGSGRCCLNAHLNMRLQQTKPFRYWNAGWKIDQNMCVKSWLTKNRTWIFMDANIGKIKSTLSIIAPDTLYQFWKSLVNFEFCECCVEPANSKKSAKTKANCPCITIRIINSTKLTVLNCAFVFGLLSPVPWPKENTASVMRLSTCVVSADCAVVVMMKSIMTVTLPGAVPEKCQMR